MLDIFLLIAFVPFKTGYLFKWPHYGSLYIVKIYTKMQLLASRLFNRDSNAASGEGHHMGGDIAIRM